MLPYVEFNSLLTEFALARSALQRIMFSKEIMRNLFEHYNHDNEHLIGNRDLMNELRLSNYGFIIVDPASTLLAVPLSLGVPFGAMALGAFPSFLCRIPRLPSVSRALRLGFTDQMKFSQRPFNLVFELIRVLTYISKDQWM